MYSLYDDEIIQMLKSGEIWEEISAQYDVPLSGIMEIAGKRIQQLEDALREIVDECGKVCEEYETCTHIACSSSYKAWAIAKQVLKYDPTATSSQ